ncbi:MAG: hypothetical protein ACYDBA_13690, partial [Sulfuricaulis sp.]
VIRAFRNQGSMVNPYGYKANDPFQLCGQLFARSQVCILRFVPGVAHRPRLHEVPTLWTQ